MKKLIEVRNLTKRFGEVIALDNFNFILEKNEIVGLIGDNAAGKSTFLKTVYGIHKPDSGQIYINEKESTIKNPSDARNLGIEMVFQDFMICTDLNAVQNAFLGKEETKFGFLKKGYMKKEVQKILREKSFELESDKLAQILSGGQQQFLAILKIFLFHPNVLLLDEPTANLSKGASENLAQSLKLLMKNKNIGMVYVSHDLREVISISDRIIVMRRGKNIANLKSSKVTPSELLAYMMGKEREIK